MKVVAHVSAAATGVALGWVAAAEAAPVTAAILRAISEGNAVATGLCLTGAMLVLLGIWRRILFITLAATLLVGATVGEGLSLAIDPSPHSRGPNRN